MHVNQQILLAGEIRLSEPNCEMKKVSHPPLQPVDNNVVRVVCDVECDQTQVGEIPQEL